MFCQSCGKQLPDDAQFCPYCSHKTVSGLYQDDCTGSQPETEPIEETDIPSDSSVKGSDEANFVPSSTGHSHVLSTLLFIICIILDIVLFFLIGTDSLEEFISISKWSGILFGISLLLRLLGL